MSPSSDFLEVLIADGAVRHRDAVLTPLSGGVSSDIYRVDDGEDVFVVKRALPKLRVQDDWFVDLSRNRYELEYLRYVGRILPDAVPVIRFASRQHGYFAMEYLGDGFANWKQLLLAGDFQVSHAIRAGQILGLIHARSAGDQHAAAQFDSTGNFHQLRTDPYLLTTGRRHPALRDLFETEAERLDSTHECLVHGDFSPKNILWRRRRMVILACEVAWYGDPAFDVAFLLNHLFLKSLYHAPRGGPLAELVRAVWGNYATTRSDAAAAQRVAARLPRLLLMLMLARIDGKSPAEYLTDERRKDFVREFVYRQLLAPAASLDDIEDRWFEKLNDRVHHDRDPD
jgi:aminoglycoside phosphotransferase (APT) family kinase protein